MESLGYSRHLFFTLGLISLYRKNWVLFYPPFAVATLNRETTCFLTIIYLFTAIGKSRFRTIALHCLFQFIIWVAIKYMLYRIYIDNPGSGIIESHFTENFKFLLDPLHYPNLFSSIGFLWIPALIYYRLVKDDFARRSLLVAIPYFLGMLFVGIVYELRIYGELIPVFLVAFFLIMREIIKRPAAESA